MSRRGASASLEFGRILQPRKIAIAQIGTLISSTDPHQKCSRRNPPAIGPRATAAPVTADQMPIAWARSLASVNTFDRIASVVGKIRAAPMPIRARAAIS